MFTLAVHRVEWFSAGVSSQWSPKGASLTHPGGIPTVNLVHKDIVIYNGN